MKQLILLFFLATSAISAFAQFPLGSDAGKIKAYFAENISYASLQEFKVDDGTKAICFTKVKVVGDYTFYFDHNDKCAYYVVTYDEKELPDLTRRFDTRFCREQTTKWVAEDNSFSITLVPPKSGGNYFSIIYRPVSASAHALNSLASN